MPDDGLREFLAGRLTALSRTAYLLTGNHHAAEDLLQNALVIVATRWRRVAAADDPMAYVRRILYHEHVSTWRRNRHLRAEYSTARVPDRRGPRDVSSDVVRRVVLERALAKLTPRQRAVIVARFFEDLTEVDAAALGCSPSPGTSTRQDRGSASVWAPVSDRWVPAPFSRWCG